MRSALLALLALPLLVPPALGAAPTCEDLAGAEFPGFTLPATGEQLVTYKDTYYGKHHLILTFFPAAFTPV